MFIARLRVLIFFGVSFGFILSDLSASGSTGAFSQQELRQGFRSGRLLAQPKAATAAQDLATQEQLHGAHLHREIGASGKLRILDLSNVADIQAAAKQLRASGLYEYVEPDYIRHPHAVPNDTLFPQQWSLHNTGQNGGQPGADINAETGWSVQSSASAVIVAVIDSGLRPTHQDLAPVLWNNPTPNTGGYVGDLHGINTLATKGSSADADISDNEGHGTEVASVIAAAGNNTVGMTGVSWNTQLMVCKFNDASEDSLVSNEIICLNYAVTHGAKVVNISYGSSEYSQSEYDAIKAARDSGVIVVVSAGNDGASNDTFVEYPASYLLENLVAVANSDRTDNLDPSSTYGSLVELAAPGTNIITCTKDSDSSYSTPGGVSGTSFSAPHVTGALALITAKFPAETYRQHINRLLNSVHLLSSLSGKVTTGGRLDLGAALSSTNNRPFNDNFANAAMLTGNAINTRGVSVGATGEASEPVHGAAGGASLWWVWTAPSSGSAAVDTAGSDFDTTAAVYTGTALNNLSQLASNDNFSSTVTTSRVVFNAVAGVTYHIAVDGKNGATGMVALSVGLAPSNDAFANATALTGESDKVTGTNANASQETGEPALSGDGATGAGKTVWYTWTASSTGTFSFSAYTSSFGPILGVFTGTSVGSLANLATDTETVTFDAVAGRVYHIAVDSSDGNAGSFVLTFLKGQAIPLVAAVTPSPALTPDGSLLLTDSSSLLFYYQSDNNFFADQVGGSLDVNTPAVASNNTFYVSSTTGLYAIQAQGSSNFTTTWSKPYNGVASSPAVAADGTVYIHSDDGVLHALAASGTEKWTATVPGISYSSPAIGADGTIYIGSDDQNLYAINPANGSVVWTFNAGGQIYSSPAIGSNGTIYFGTLSSQFFAVSASGTKIWSYATGDEVSSSAAIGTDGTLYFGSYDDKLYALTSTGTLKWTFTTGDQIRASSPAVAADGTIYIGSYDGKLYGVTPSGTQKAVYNTGAEIRSSPLIDSDQGLLFGSGDQRVYIVDLGGVGQANSSWPMFRQNAQRTGRVPPSDAPISIAVQPSSTAAAIGGSATLSIVAQSQSAVTYQWYLNGTAIAGATAATYTITNATAANAGSYDVVLTNNLGTVTSDIVTVSVVAPSALGRLANLSARAMVGTGDQTLIVGLVVGSGTGFKPILVRGLGPSLQPNGITDFFDDPALSVHNGASIIGSNDNWGTAAKVTDTTTQVGAAPLTSAEDAALVVSLSPGPYTAVIGPGASSVQPTGVALAEFYDAATTFTGTTPNLVNISARAQVGTGNDVLIVGFVVAGTTPIKVLIRGLGPELVKQKLPSSEVLSDPSIRLVNQSTGATLQSNDNWGDAPNLAEVQAAMAKVTTNDLDTGSKDSAILTTLQPGVYTAVVSGVNNTTGIALAEIYQVQ